jgi:hypothetical protein
MCGKTLFGYKNTKYTTSVRDREHIIEWPCLPRYRISFSFRGGPIPFFVARACHAAMMCGTPPNPHIALATLAYAGLLRGCLFETFHRHAYAAPQGYVWTHISTELSSLSGRGACGGSISTKLLPLSGIYVCVGSNSYRYATPNGVRGEE